MNKPYVLILYYSRSGGTQNLALHIARGVDKVVGIELPQFVELEIDSVEPGSRGDTASGGVTTNAYTTTGVRVQVPLFIKPGDTVRMDTATGNFKDRKN